ncbi:unnamed protein product [Durusdinium trenchii]|uniref:Dipeptidase n=1 Tax=Durusdinium trenchii TaxID=1381693 RepID=A0ABP0MW98_9DINO
MWRRAMAMALRLLLLPLATRGFDIDGCTSIVVNADAMQDGSAVTSHANDCADCDWRVAYVPAQDHPEGSERIIYDAVWSQYPRLVDPSRSKSYQPAMGITSTAVLGRIPQVKHTYALWEASYGLMNEHGVGMGESTCSAFLVGTGLSQGGTALFSIGNLMAIALERCKTARCAIQTMGDLGAFYGFYGEDPGMGGAGEAVTLVDQSGEAWVFHICGGVPSSEKNASWATQRGALWAAQRVPSGHVAVVANSMIIRQIDFEDKENFMLHPGLKDLLQEAKLWNGRGQLDWQKAVSPNMETFSYFPGLAPIPMYSTLRMWGVYRQAAPSAKIRATKDLGSFPFSVPVDGKVSILDVMNWFRTHYEGTEFDMRYGSLAGPFQSPNRAEGGDGAKAVPGQFARATSIPRTSYTVLLQSGIKQPRVWFAPDASASSIFVPFFASALDANAQGRFDVAAYGTGSMKSFSFDGARSAWWAHDFVANWMDLSYQNMSEQYVYPKVQRLQREVYHETQEAIDHAESSLDLAERASQIQRKVTEEWWRLAEQMVVRYNDHFYNFPESDPTNVGSIGYPAFWLEMIGYDQEFYRPHWFQRSPWVPKMLPDAIKEQLGTPPEFLAEALTWALSPSPPTLCLLLLLPLTSLMTYLVGYRRGLQAAQQDIYCQLSA